MPTLGTAHLPEPTDWNEFEDICADLFSREWNDPNITRYGLQGQRQDGVDTYGTSMGEPAGLQCKGRRNWPLRKLKTKDIDAAVAEARNFQPPLKTFSIVTTAPVGKPLQDHARKISLEHETQGLFKVFVTGWSELYRRLTQHDELVTKHYGLFTLSDVRQGLASVQQSVSEAAKTATEQHERTTDHLGDLTQAIAALSESNPPSREVPSFDPLEGAIAEAIERDFASRYALAMRRSLFPEANKSEALQDLATELLASSHAGLSTSLRRRILLRAARSSALRSKLDDAERFFAAGIVLQREDRDAPARARLAEAHGNIDAAIQLLRNEDDADSRSTLLNILGHHRGDEAGLAYLKEKSIAVTDLTGNGVYALCHLHVRRKDLASVKTILESASEAQLAESPYLLFLRGAVRLAVLVPKPDQALVIRGLPPHVQLVHIVGPKATAASTLDAAIADLNQIISLAPELGLHHTKRLAEAYALWCELLHPDRRDAALDKLRRDMQDPRLALRKLQFAFAFDKTFDRAPIAMYLEKRDQFGGLDAEELAAAFVLHLHSDDPRAFTNFISKQRAPLAASFDPLGIAVSEIQALAQAKDATAARIVFEQHRGQLDEELATALEGEIAKAEGADPVTESKRVYETTRSVEALRVLVGVLLKQNDYPALGHYAEILYRETGDPIHAALAAKALANSGDDAGFLRLIEPCSAEVRDQDLVRHYAWLLFQRGRLKEAAHLAEELRRNSSSDLGLEIAIAVQIGAWDSLAIPLNDYLHEPQKYGGPALIRAAHLAQASAQGQLMALMDAAIRLDSDDPDVLVGAYSLVLEQGLEDKKPEATEWFRRALDLSGDDGPVKAFKLKDLVAHQLEWQEHSRQISEAVVSGKLPLGFAASALNTTFVDIILGGLVRNRAIDDPRRRAALPLFNGQRNASTFAHAARIALDVSTLIVTGWLGILQKTIDSYGEIVIAAGALHELFDGCARIRRVQKSRVDRAQKLQAAIARGQIKVLPANSERDARERDIGTELATLLAAARRANGIVIRPPPVMLLDGRYETEVNMTADAEYLTDMRSVLNALTNAGAIDEATEDTARSFFDLQDRGWPTPAAIAPETPLFVDWLALTHLQTVGLLDVFFRTFRDVHVTGELKEEADSINESEQQAQEILDTVDTIRGVVHKAYLSGKLVFGPHRTPTASESERDRITLSTLNLVADLLKSDMMIVDDRSANKDIAATDNHGHRAGLGTSLDLIEDLAARAVISSAERRALRHRLRAGGALLVPVETEEVLLASLRSGQRESAELRAIRETIGIARIAGIPQFPAEIRWFTSTTMAIQHALIQLWGREPDHKRAAQMSEVLLDMRPEPEDWVSCWDGTPPPEWCDSVRRVMAAGLCLPFEIDTPEATRAYHSWLEPRVIEPLRAKSPDTYQAVIDYIRCIVADSSGGRRGA